MADETRLYHAQIHNQGKSTLHPVQVGDGAGNFVSGVGLKFLYQDLDNLRLAIVKAKGPSALWDTGDPTHDHSGAEHGPSVLAGTAALGWSGSGVVGNGTEGAKAFRAAPWNHQHPNEFLNKWFYRRHETTFTTAAAYSSVDVSSLVGASTPFITSGNSSAEGVISDTPLPPNVGFVATNDINKIFLYDDADGSPVVDSNGREIYGRLNSSGTNPYTHVLHFFVNASGTETAVTIVAGTYRFAYRRQYELNTLLVNWSSHKDLFLGAGGGGGSSSGAVTDENKLNQLAEDLYTDPWTWTANGLGRLAEPLQKTLADHMADTVDPHGASMTVSTKVITPRIDSSGLSLNIGFSGAGGQLLPVNNNDVALGNGNYYWSSVHAAQYLTTISTASSEVFRVKVAGDTEWPFAIIGRGKLNWGSGSATRDAFLERTAAATLQLTSTLNVTSRLNAPTVGTTSGDLSLSPATGKLLINTTGSYESVNIGGHVQLLKDANDLTKIIFGLSATDRRATINALSGGLGTSDNGIVFGVAFEVTGTAGAPTYTSRQSATVPLGIRLLNKKIDFVGETAAITGGTAFTPTVRMSLATDTGILDVSGGLKINGTTALDASRNATLGTVDGSIINATTGFRIGGAAASGNFLRGNGTNFIADTIKASDLSAGINGTIKRIPKFTGANTIGNSIMWDTGTNLGINFSSDTGITERLTVAGNAYIATGSSIAYLKLMSISNEPTFLQTTAWDGVNAAGRGLWMSYNADWEGSQWIARTASIPVYQFSVNRHLGFTWRYAAGTTADTAVTPTEVMKLTSAGELTVDTVNATTITGSNITLSGLAAGGVTFGGSGGALTQDTSNLFWNDTLNTLSLGYKGSQERLGLSSDSYATVGMQDGPTPTATPATTGGSLATGTYYYKIVGFDGVGTTLPGTEVSANVTGPTGSVALAWTAIPGAVSYRVYKGTTTNGQNTYFTVTATSYTDTGAAGTAGSPPTVSTAYTHRLGGTHLDDNWILSDLGIGTATPYSLTKLEVAGRDFGLIASDTLTDATTKTTRIATRHYTTAEKPMLGFMLQSSSAENTVNIGGGTGYAKAATVIGFYAAANITTDTGTLMGQVKSDGWSLGTTSNFGGMLNVLGTTFLKATAANQTILSLLDSAGNIPLYFKDGGNAIGIISSQQGVHIDAQDAGDVALTVRATQTGGATADLQQWKSNATGYSNTTVGYVTNVGSAYFATNLGLGQTPDSTYRAYLGSGAGIRVPVGTYTVLSNEANPDPSVAPATDGFRVRYDNDFYATSIDALVIEKTDTNQAAVDGGIAFVFTGSDNIKDLVMSLRDGGVSVLKAALNTGVAFDVAGVVNADTGYRVNNAAPAGQYLRGNGTDAVFSAIQAADLSGIISGTADYLPKFTGANTLGNSVIRESNGKIGIGGGLIASQRLELWAGNLRFSAVTRPTAPSAAIVAAAGNLSVGTYRYKVTYSTALGETESSDEVSIAVANNTTGGQVQLTIPTSSATGDVTERVLYRTRVNDNIFWRLAVVNNNTATTYTDNIADSALSLGFTAPTVNVTTGGVSQGTTAATYYDSAGHANNTRLLRYRYGTVFGGWRNDAALDVLPTGRLTNRNPNFLMSAVSAYATSGITGYYLYNNSGGTKTQYSVVSDPSAPNVSGRVMRLQYDSTNVGSTSPGFGGFYVGTSLNGTDGISGLNLYKKGSRLVHVIWAKIPVGRTIVFASNSTGDGANSNWLTDVAGTGDWKRYVLVRSIGETGTLSTTSFFYVAGGADATFTWDVAGCHILAVDEESSDTHAYLNIGYKPELTLGFGDMHVLGHAYLASDVTKNVGIRTTAPTEAVEVGGTNSKIYLNSATSNTILYNANGVGAPTVSTRSAGTKAVLFPALSSTETDYAVGMESTALWFSVPSSTKQFKWYGATTERMRLTGDGLLGLGATTLVDLLTVGGHIAITGGVNRAVNHRVGADTASTLDFNTVDVTTQTASIRFHRSTNTTSAADVHFMKGDGTASIQSLLSGKGNSYLNALAGNVGIGHSATPEATLHVKSGGSFRIGLGTDLTFLDLSTNQLIFNRNGFSYIDQAVVGGSLAFRVSRAATVDTTSLFIQTDGKVGIFRTDPARELDIFGSLRLTGNVYMPDTATYLGFLKDAGSALSIKVRSIGVGVNYSNSGTALADGVVNAETGYQVNNAAPAGQYLRGNGTNAVFSALLAADMSASVAGTTGQLAKFTGANTVSDSIISEVSGKIGVNNTSPYALLHVGAATSLNFYGNIAPTVMAAETSGIAQFGATVADGTNNRRASLFVDHTNNIWGLHHTYSTGGSPFVIQQANQEVLRLGTNGRIGIGTTNALYNYHQIGGRFSVGAVNTPGAPTVTPQGTAGTTSYTYHVVAVDRSGEKTLTGAAGTTSMGNATLSATNFNRITWASVPGAYYYHILKLDAGVKKLIGTIYDGMGTTLQLDDTGLVMSAYTEATRNTTADMIFGGYAGFGTNAPAKKIHVVDSGILISGSSSGGDAEGARFAVDAGVSTGHVLMKLKNNNGTVLYVDGSKVGIGTESTEELLTLGLPTGDGANTSRKAIRMTNGGWALPGVANTNSDGDKLIFWEASNSEAHKIGLESSHLWIQSAGGVKFYNSSAVEKARIALGSGDSYFLTDNFGVGTSTIPAGVKFHSEGVINTLTGYRVNNAAPTGQYLRGDGANAIFSAIQVGDVPTLNQNTTGDAWGLTMHDNRTVIPSEIPKKSVRSLFTTFKNDGTSPYADGLAFEGWSDSSGGSSNLLVIKKTGGFGMRIFQKAWDSAGAQSVTAFAEYRDIALVSASQTLNYLPKYTQVADGIIMSQSQIIDTGTNVGIDVTGPLEKFEVKGTGVFSGDASTKRIIIGNSHGEVGVFGSNANYGSGITNIVFSASNANASNSGYINVFNNQHATVSERGNIHLVAGHWADSNMLGSINLWTGGKTRLFAANSGLVGLNTTTPTAGLHQLGGGVLLAQLASAGAPTVTPQGTVGSTTYRYYVVAKDGAGNKTLTSAVGQTTTGNAILDATNFNRVAWTAVAGAESYDLLREDAGVKKFLATVSTTTYDDTGAVVLTAYTEAVYNATGNLALSGRIIMSSDVELYRSAAETATLKGSGIIRRAFANTGGTLLSLINDNATYQQTFNVAFANASKHITVQGGSATTAMKFLDEAGTTRLFVGMGTGGNTNIGINEEAPNAALHIKKATGAHTLLNLQNSGDTVGDEARIDFTMSSVATAAGGRIGVIRQGANAMADMYFSVNTSAGTSTERMRLVGSTGNFGVGVTSDINERAIVRGSIVAGVGVPTVNAVVNGAKFFTGESLDGGKAGVVGLGHSSMTIPTLGTYGTVGVVGAAGNSTGGRVHVGVHGYAEFAALLGGNAGNNARGGYFLSKITAAVTDFVGVLYGSHNKADASAGSGTGGSVYGSYNEAIGHAGTGDTAYGGYFSATGGTSNWGVYSAAGSNYFAADARIGSTSLPTGTKLHVEGVINALTGYRVNNAAPSGQYLRGNATDFVASAIQAGDLPISISGTQNKVAKFNAGGNGVVDSLITDDGTGVAIGGTPSTTSGLLYLVGGAAWTTSNWAKTLKLSTGAIQFGSATNNAGMAHNGSQFYLWTSTTDDATGALSYHATMNGTGVVLGGSSAPENRLEAVQNLHMRRIADATSTVTTQSSRALFLQAAYWDGVALANANRSMYLQALMTNTTPSYRLGILDNSGIEKFTFTHDGKLGVNGIVAPAQALDVNGNIRLTNGVFMPDTATHLAFVKDGGGALALKTGGIGAGGTFANFNVPTFGAYFEGSSGVCMGLGIAPVTMLDVSGGANFRVETGGTLNQVQVVSSPSVAGQGGLVFGQSASYLTTNSKFKMWTTGTGSANSGTFHFGHAPAGNAPDTITELYQITKEGRLQLTPSTAVVAVGQAISLTMGRVQLADGTLNSEVNGITIGSDANRVNLYKEDANKWKTDDSLHVVADVQVDGKLAVGGQTQTVGRYKRDTWQATGTDAARQTKALSQTPITVETGVLKLEVYVGGMLQTEGYDYSITGATITFLSTAIPEEGAVCNAIYDY